MAKQKQLLRVQIIKPSFELVSKDPCVFRLYAGKKFLIWKGKNLSKSIDVMTSDIARKILKDDLSHTDVFYKIVDHIRKFRTYNLELFPLLSSEDNSELLQFESQELLKAKSDPDCCNISFEPYVPAWMNLGSNKASGSSVSNTIEPRVQKLPKVRQIEEKQQKTDVLPLTSTPQVLEMPDFDPSDLLDSL